MANPEQLELLKAGVEGWNKWRRVNRKNRIDLSGANLVSANLKKANLNCGDLSNAELNGVDLSYANLKCANLHDADLTLANLYKANLNNADLSNASLFEAELSRATLSNAKLKDADLSNACLNFAVLTNAKLDGVSLSETDLSETDLRGIQLEDEELFSTDFSESNLTGANFSGTQFFDVKFTGTILKSAILSHAFLDGVDLCDAELSNAEMGFTHLSKMDLSETRGLIEIKHTFPSFIDTQTLKFSRGKIPKIFLRGCGLSDWEIESAKLHNPDLTNEEIVQIQYRMFDFRATRAFQISPLFISYSHADTPFVDHMDRSLTEKGIRFWRDIHDTKAGRLETQIDLAIRQNPTVLIVLSKNSLSSDWVEHEVRHARKLEKELDRDVLCPIALDDSWKSSKWPERLMEQVMEYNILNFSGWEDNLTFESKFAKLLNGLDLFYKKPAK